MTGNEFYMVYGEGSPAALKFDSLDAAQRHARYRTMQSPGREFIVLKSLFAYKFTPLTDERTYDACGGEVWNEVR